MTDSVELMVGDTGCGMDKEPGRGTQFKIYLPMAKAAADSVRSVQRTRKLPHGSETILVVEDDSSLREVTCEFLRSSGYRVRSAPSADEALRLVESHDGPIDVLLTDVTMPKMNRRELARILVKARPELKVLYVSGYADGIVWEQPQGGLEEGLRNFSRSRGISDTADCPGTRNARRRGTHARTETYQRAGLGISWGTARECSGIES